VRTPFTGNIIPRSYMDPVALNVQKLIPSPPTASSSITASTSSPTRATSVSPALRSIRTSARSLCNRGAWVEANNLVQLNSIPEDRLRAFGLNLNNAADRDLLTRNLNDPLVVARGFRLPYQGLPH
jgi:hypothetical protein